MCCLVLRYRSMRSPKARTCTARQGAPSRQLLRRALRHFTSLCSTASMPGSARRRLLRGLSRASSSTRKCRRSEMASTSRRRSRRSVQGAPARLGRLCTSTASTMTPSLNMWESMVWAETRGGFLRRGFPGRIRSRLARDIIAN
jgi:hypothetical protein